MYKHLIITNGRSGSNYVSNLLNQHPHLINYGEVLGDWTLPYKLYSSYAFGPRDVISYLEFLYTSRSFFYVAQLYSSFNRIINKRKVYFKRYSSIYSIGIKDFTINFKRRRIANYLKSHPEIYVINLYRENQLKRLISLEMMRANKIVSVKNYNSRKNHQRNFNHTKIRLDPLYVWNQLTTFQAEIDDQFKMIKNHPKERIFTIKYENLFASETSLRRITKNLFKFLHVKPISSRSYHRKILPNNIYDLLANYDEIRLALKDTKFESFFDD